MRSPLTFLKIGKKCLIFEKNALIVVICVLNFSFKMQLLGVSRRKNWIFFPAGSFFLVLCMITYHSALISRKFPFPKNFLVTCLMKDNLCQKITLKYDLSCIIKKYIYFTKKGWSYSLGGKRKISFSEEYTGYMIFSIYSVKMVFFSYKNDVTFLWK